MNLGNNDNTQLQQGDNLNLSREFTCSYIDAVIVATRNGTADWKSGFIMEGRACRSCLFRGRLLLYRVTEASQALLYITIALSEEEEQRYMEHKLSITTAGVTVSGDYAVRAIQRIEKAHHICATRRDRRERIKRVLNSDLTFIVVAIAVAIVLIYAAVVVGLSLRA